MKIKMSKLINKFPILTSVVMGFILLLPLVALEFVNRQQFKDGFPFAIYSFTWFVQSFFILILLQLIKTIRTRKTSKQYPLFLILRIIGLVFISHIWAGWIIDQWPCLIGVPNCD